MSGSGTLLPLPDDPRLNDLENEWALAGGFFDHFEYPRSRWLGLFESVLREHYPSASSRDLSLTARHHAPFPLRDGPNVP